MHPPSRRAVPPTGRSDFLDLFHCTSAAEISGGGTGVIGALTLWKLAERCGTSPVLAVWVLLVTFHVLQSLLARGLVGWRFVG